MRLILLKILSTFKVAAENPCQVLTRAIDFLTKRSGHSRQSLQIRKHLQKWLQLAWTLLFRSFSASTCTILSWISPKNYGGKLLLVPIASTQRILWKRSVLGSRVPKMAALISWGQGWGLERIAWCHSSMVCSRMRGSKLWTGLFIGQGRIGRHAEKNQAEIKKALSRRTVMKTETTLERERELLRWQSKVLTWETFKLHSQILITTRSDLANILTGAGCWSEHLSCLVGGRQKGEGVPILAKLRSQRKRNVIS